MLNDYIAQKKKIFPFLVLVKICIEMIENIVRQSESYCSYFYWQDSKIAISKRHKNFTTTNVLDGYILAKRAKTKKLNANDPFSQYKV